MQKLAIEGGPKAKKHPYGYAKRFGKEELKQLAEALDQQTLFYAAGKKVKEMCATFARMLGMKHCIATSSGTASIHVALGALRIRPGDEVITSPITDFGTVIGILYQNAIPVFADLDPHTYCMTPQSIARRITKKTRAIVLVQLAGGCSDMAPILRLAKRRKIAVVEDCAQSIMGKYRGRYLGTMGALGCFSLNDWKHISCGDGGVVVTDDDELAARATMFADKNYRRTPGGSPLREIASLAPNYRMTELQGAVAIAQLGKVNRICSRRHAVGEGYTKGITGIPGIFPHAVVKGGWSVYWFYMFRMDPKVLGVSRNEFTEALKCEGVNASPGYIPAPLYEWEIFRNLSAFPGTKYPWTLSETRKGVRFYRPGLCPESERILETAVHLPVKEYFTATDVRETVAAIRKVAGHFLGFKGIRLQ